MSSQIIDILRENAGVFNVNVPYFGRTYTATLETFHSMISTLTIDLMSKYLDEDGGKISYFCIEGFPRRIDLLRPYTKVPLMIAMEDAVDTYRFDEWRYLTREQVDDLFNEGLKALQEAVKQITA